MPSQMQITGIIAEYNPFHNGHRYQVEEARRAGASHLVAVLGGNFLQRGGPALVDKRVRTAAALAGGVDLVLELPLPYACATAQRFAWGGVAILDALGCVDSLSFGSEAGDLAALTRLAGLLDAPELAEALAPPLAAGVTFAAARQQAVARLAGEDLSRLLASPNNILGVEYLRQLNRLGSAIRPRTVTRRGADYHQNTPGQGGMASATYLRGLAHRGDWSAMTGYIPEESHALLTQAARAGQLAHPQRMDLPVLSRLRTMTLEDFQKLPDLSEGLEHRLYRAVRQGGSLPQVLALAKTKRYSLARLRRLVMAAWLGLEEGMNAPAPPAIRVLGMNDKGAEILARAKDSATLPLSHSPARLAGAGPRAAQLAALEARSVDLFQLLTDSPKPCGWDYTAGLVKL